MSDAIIARGSRSSSSGSGTGTNTGVLVTNIFTNNGYFVMPTDVYENRVYVRIFGGGGGANHSGGDGICIIQYYLK